MIKTLEEVMLMDVPQLKGILSSLDIPFPDLDYRKSENKQKLVQLVFDIQQPDVDQEQELDAVPLDPQESINPSVEEIEQALSPLRDHGLKYEIRESTIKLIFNNCSNTLTLFQPLSRTVSMARNFCRAG